MTVREIFDLRKHGHIEEAYNAIRPMSAVHKGHYTSLCMYLCARDVFHLRLSEGRIEEAAKIYQALQRLVTSIEDKDGRVSAFMQYASSRLDSVDCAQRFGRCGNPSPLSRMSPYHGDPNPAPQTNFSVGLEIDSCNPCSKNKNKSL